MKTIVLSLLFAGCFQVASAQTQTAKPEAPKMIQLYFVLLTRGPNRSHDSVTARNIQAGHMANMKKLHEQGKLLLAGPFGDNGNWRGLFILKAKDLAEAENMVKTDPAVVAGRLAYEIHPWWTEENCVLK